MEYVRVMGEADADVYIDDSLAGKVGDVLRVSKGRHVFTLAGPDDGSRSREEVDVESTSSVLPLEVHL